MSIILGADVGGTKTLVQLWEVVGSDWHLLRSATYASRDFANLTQLLQDFLSQGSVVPQRACLGIPGPVIDQTAQVTNLGWRVSAHELQDALNIPCVTLLNDFAAVAYGSLVLPPSDIVVLQERPRRSQAPIALLGAGTGLGEALMLWQGDRYQVLPIEGGHTDFPPRNELEIGLLRYLWQHYERVSVERVVSGPGLVNIYDYLKSIEFAPETAAVQTAMATMDRAAVISQFGMAGDPLCAQALTMFVAAYGAEAGNLALKSLPLGGIFIAGGIAAKILPKMTDGTFLTHFLDKGRFRPLMEQLFVAVITNPEVGLLGTVHLAAQGG
ncbi:glucokinase [Parathermosynechococcus lividus]|jgi:glucokinase|uniref:Glucokinase n=1 Tax=Parathermosynechococcus lividus PCC 6715 TaxID=1917166 RepID=A0A2D2Q0S2_PARLV|nr:glucokinase [Thermostichus lividus]ATS18096.1 glucokinase [Thermostichus lividus PCC 6715]